MAEISLEALFYNFYRIMLSFFLTAVFVFLLPEEAVAGAPSCHDLFTSFGTQTSNAHNEQKILQMFKYEAENNDPLYVVPFQNVAVEMVEVPVSSLRISALTEDAKNNLQDLVYENTKGEKVFLWPKHPFNQDTRVTFAKKKTAQVCEDCYTTSSRSILNQKGLYTFKLSTDHPQAGKPSDPEKLDSLKNAKVSEVLSPVVLDLEKKEPSSSPLLIDDLIIYPKSAPEHAFLGRSYAQLLRLNPDKSYLAASSVMEFSAEWAAKLGMTESEFRVKYWAEPLGKLEADLALKYAIMLDSPHEQNFLVEFDQQGKPTGRLVARDLSDIYIRPSFVFGKKIKKMHERLNKDGDFDDFQAFGFDFAYGSWLDGADANALHQAHQAAFLKQIKHLLKIDELPIVGRWKDERVETNQGWVTRSPDYNNEWSRLKHILDNLNNESEIAKNPKLAKTRERILELQGE